MVFVTKADGSKQPFQKEKVIRTCMRIGANESQAREVADRIEDKIYDGIPTSKILQMLFTYLKEHRPEVAHRIDLRESIGLMRPRPDFEIFVTLLLKEFGYEASGSQLIRGKCVEHEIDGIAKKNDQTVYVEVKHHFQHHTFTGVSVFLEAQAILEDLIEGFNSGKLSTKFDRALVVCNTKFSEHALEYAACKKIEYLGWSAPLGKSLEQMIGEKGLYPITLLKILNKKTEERLGDCGIVLLKQLLQYNTEELYKKTRIPRDRLEELARKAKEILK